MYIIWYEYSACTLMIHCTALAHIVSPRAASQRRNSNHDHINHGIAETSSTQQRRRQRVTHPLCYVAITDNFMFALRSCEIEALIAGNALVHSQFHESWILSSHQLFQYLISSWYHFLASRGSVIFSLILPSTAEYAIHDKHCGWCNYVACLNCLYIQLAVMRDK